MSIRSRVLASLVIAFGVPFHAGAWAQQGELLAWGAQFIGGDPAAGFTALSVGQHILGLTRAGSIAAWGSNLEGQCSVPEPNSRYVAVAAGGPHSLGLKADGSIVAWGSNNEGQCIVPGHNTGFVAIAAAGTQSLAIRAPSENPPVFVRGDANASGKVEIADAIYALGYLFGGGPVPVRLDAADTDDSGRINIADAVSTLQHLFAGAGPLPEPFGACGVDPTDDDGLSCAASTPCGGPWREMLRKG